ncbi:MAG: metal-sensitive transcriptional regulator [bacterium]
MNYIQQLKRIEGQIRGVISMIKQNRECEEILVQLAAIRSGITRVMIERLKERLLKCLTEDRDQAKMKEDFVNILNKLMKFMS